MKADRRWLDDPEAFAVNRLPAHSDHSFYQNTEEADQGRSGLVLSLAGEWNFRYACDPSEVPADFGESVMEAEEVEGWDLIPVPSHIEMAGYRPYHYINSDYPWEAKHLRRPAGTISTVEECRGDFSEAEDNPVGLYVKKFTLPDKFSGKNVHILFEGVEEAMYLWLNGSFVGYAEDSFTPSEFDLTPWIREGENTLCAAVYRMSTAAWLEDQDFFRFFGIFRDVKLLAIPACHLEDISLHPAYDPETGAGNLTMDLKLKVQETCQVILQLTDPCGQVIWQGQAEAESIMQVDCGCLGRVEAWDYSHPSIYRLRICLTDPSGQICEVDQTELGFRHLEVREGVIHLNGHRLYLCGVNRHEWSAERGRAITGKEMEEDIACILRNNINAVRTCHYPDQLEWYRMCDRAGIYVMAETNMESHGSWQKGCLDRTWNIPGSFPAWRGVVMDRVASNYEWLKNHPSILFWSLGNESCAGENVCAMNAYYKEKDPDRLTHYESSYYTPEYRDRISDVESRMYADPGNIREYLENQPDKPYILCEFMHDMGNSMGGLNSYMDLFDFHPMYHGGFIWDMIDQALWVEDEVTGRKVLRYGGDFDDRPSNNEFSGNGILFADRSEKPAMQEVRGLYGRYCRRGICKEETIQELIPEEKNEKESISGEDGLHLVYGDSFLGLQGKDISWIFSYTEGGPVSLRKGGREWLYRAPRPSFWRATTCNDRGNGFSNRSAMWMGADLFMKQVDIRVRRDGEEIPLPKAPINNYYSAEDMAHSMEIIYTLELPVVPVTCVEVSYLVSGRGVCRVKVDYQGKEGLPELPVFGWRMVAPTPADGFTYCGLSGETYPDRRDGGKRGIYSLEGMPVTNYMLPQECGMHVETSWLEVSRSTSLDEGKTGAERVDRKKHWICETGYGQGIPGNARGTSVLRIREDQENFAFSCLPYTAQELENAGHQEELPPVRRTVLLICGKVRGVGGINSWGADVEAPYHIRGDEDLSMSFILE